MIVVMAAMAGTNLLCALDCYQPAVAEADHCHGAAPGTGPVFAAGHDCASHQLQVAAAPARVEVSIVLAPDLACSVAIESPVARAVFAELPIRTAASPPGPTVVPLRI